MNAELEKILENGIDLDSLRKIPRHPLFELADSNPVILFNNQVYIAQEGNALEGDLFEDNGTTRQLTLVATTKSLDEIAAERTSEELASIQGPFISDLKEDFYRNAVGSNSTKEIKKAIYDQVFPHLRRDKLDRKVDFILDTKQKAAKAHPIQEPENPLDEDLVSEREIERYLSEARELIEIIELEKRKEEEKEQRIKRQLNQTRQKPSKLDLLLGFPGPNEKIAAPEPDSEIGRIVEGNIAIISGEIYDITKYDRTRRFIQLGGQKYGLSKTNAKIPKEKIEVGDRIRVNANGNGYAYTQAGSEGIVRRIYNGDNDANIDFSKLTGGGSHRYPQNYTIRIASVDNLEVIETGTTKILEDKYLRGLARRLKIEAIQKGLSKEAIAADLREKAKGLDGILGKREYSEEDFGFLEDNGQVYAYLWVPQFAIHSQFDGNYYLFDRARIGAPVHLSGGQVYRNDIIMIDNNNHPFLHNERSSFSRICIGSRNRIPTTGKTDGEVIAKALGAVKNILMHGYIGTDYAPNYCLSSSNSHYVENRRTLAEIKTLGVPIVEGER